MNHMKLKEHISIFKRAFQWFFRLHPAHMIEAMASAVVHAVMPYVPIYFSAKLIDALVKGEPLSHLVLYVSLTVGLSFLLNMATQILDCLISKDINELYRKELWTYSEKAMEMSYSRIENRETRLLYDRIQHESQTGFNLFYLRSCVNRLIQNSAQIITSFAMTFSFFTLGDVSTTSKLILCAGIVGTIVYQMFATGKTSKLKMQTWDYGAYWNLYGSKFSDYVDNYNSGKDIRVYGMSDFVSHGMLEMMEKYLKGCFRSDVFGAIFSVPSAMLEYLLQFGLYFILITAALAGGVSVGSIAKYVSCIMLMIGAVGGLVNAVQITLSNNVYLQRYFSYFDIPNEMYKGSLTVEKRNDNEYFVEFRDVSFRYPNTDRDVLRHVNLKFKIGEKLAVVGMNGSGKTTFIKLMCRLYDPTEGEIFLNGVDIRKYDYDEYMSLFSVVFQDFRLFDFTLGQNVATEKAYDRARVEQCLRKAGFGDRLDSMSSGVDTWIGKGMSDEGVEISGGEKQKIALARALYKDAPFTILDEPTAALDPVSEYEIYSKFNSIVGDKTTIYISHRMASCRFCDKIAVFDNGNIIQVGTHEELMEDEGGKYHELWQAQAQYYE